MVIQIVKCEHRESVDMYQVKLIKDEIGEVLHEEEKVNERWKMYFEQLMNERIERKVESASGSEIEEVGVEEVRGGLQKMKRGKAVGPDDIPAAGWKCLGAVS